VREVQNIFPVGTVIQGHYCVESLLGEGSSGAIYLVRDQHIKDAQDQLFILKQVIDLDKQERHRLIFEDVLLRQPPHEALPHVYKVFDDDGDGGVHILMEYIEGPNLDTLRQQQPEKRFSWPDAMTIMGPIIEAVDYLHRQQLPIIHGDIKPANIIVPKIGTRAVLVDFGVSKGYDTNATLAVGPAHSSTYQAPEQSSRGSDIRTDIYGLGATFYTLLTGMVPVDTDSRMAQLSNEGTDPLKPANEVVPDVPAFVAQVVHQAMSIHAHDRFSSMEQFWTALRSQGEELSPARDTPPALPLSPLVSKQAETGPATVPSPKSSPTSQPSGFDTTPPGAAKRIATRPATVSAPKTPRPPRSTGLDTTPPGVATRPATVSVPKTPHAPRSSKSDTAPPATAQQAVEKPVPAPKLPRAPRSWKLGSLRFIIRKQAAETLVSVSDTASPATVQQAVEEPAPAPKPPTPQFSKSDTVPPAIAEQAVEKPAPAKPPSPPPSSKSNTVPPAAAEQAVEIPAPAPKPPSPPPSSKSDTAAPATAQQATEELVSVLQKLPPSSTRLKAGKMHKVKVADKPKVEDKQSIKGTRRKARRPYFVALALLLLLLCTAGSLFSISRYQTYSAQYYHDLSEAREGIQHLQTGAALLERLQQNLLDGTTVERAQHEFTAALVTFSQLDSQLKSLPAISQSIPTYGARLRAALHLLPLTIEVSQTGVITCNTLDLLISRFHEPLNAQAQGLTTAALSLVDRGFQQIRTALNLVIGQVNHLQPEDLQLDPRLSKLVTTFHKDIPALQSWLDGIEKILPLVPTLLGVGTPTNYLIEVLDSTELRPGGGSISNYGIATFSGGRLTDVRVSDVELLDRSFQGTGGQIPVPAAYTWFDIAPTWSLRDSNLDADFPTAARYGESIYKQEGGKVPVQGVIAITPALIQHILAITGPIDVPEYQDTITAQNLIARLHYHQLGSGQQGNNITPAPNGQQPESERFTVLLTKHLLDRVRQLSPSASGKLLQLMISSLPSKDIQIYLNSSVAEHLLQSYHLDTTIQSPSGDSLFVVDANIAANKANNFITNTLDDQVTVDGEGTAVHHTTLSYAWVLKGQYYGPPLYRDYLRVYVPPGSILQTQDGWEPRGTSQAFGREVWAGFFTLPFGQTQTITLVWTVHGAAKKGTGGWHYQYTIQRQAGIQRMLHLQVKLPSCAVKITKLGGLVPSSPQVMMLAQPLNGDMNVGANYTC
jgi:serine/threonine protein kinase